MTTRTLNKHIRALAESAINLTKRSFKSRRGQIVLDLLKCYTPFLFILLAFSSLKYLVPYYDAPVHYGFMPDMDKWLTGGLPTSGLQKLLWHGHVVWYDYALYAVYAAHYVLVVLLAWLVYKYRSRGYEYFYSVYILTTISAFAFFIFYPTAPPWMATQSGYIPHITRVSAEVFRSMGVHNFASLYNHYNPDTSGAFPSLHSAYATLFAIFTFKFFGKKWGAVSLIYPALIYVDVIYLGEHYLADVLAGATLSFVCYWAMPFLLRNLRSLYSLALARLNLRLSVRDS